MQRRRIACIVGVAAGALAMGLSTRLRAAAEGPTFVCVPKSGFIVLNDVQIGPGHRIVSRFNGTRAGKCLAGTATDDYCRDYIESNAAGGKAYIAYESNSHWRFFTSQVGTSTDLEGNVDPTGAFMMAGTHALSGAKLFLVGKAKFKKNTTTPTSLSGTLYFTSTMIQEFGQVAFKSVGTAD